MVTGGIAQWVVRLEKWGDDGHAVHISAGSEDDVQHLDIISRLILDTFGIPFNRGVIFKHFITSELQSSNGIL